MKSEDNYCIEYCQCIVKYSNKETYYNHEYVGKMEESSL
jgi:hypothetical protein